MNDLPLPHSLLPDTDEFALVLQALVRKEVEPLLAQLEKENMAVRWQGDWISGQTYNRGDLVRYVGSVWIALRTTDVPPEHKSPQDWELFAAGGTTQGGAIGGLPSTATPIDAGIGLSLDTTTSPNDTMNLDPATDIEIGGIMEPVKDGIAYARKWDAVGLVWIWEPTVTAGLQINSLIPDKTMIDPTAPLLLVHAYGSEFTPTCELLVDGVAVPTNYVSETELTTLVNPDRPPGTPRIVTVTVHDPAVPEVGLGAEPFEFILMAATVLSLELIVPNEAVFGPGIADVTVHAHGAQFTPTTVVLWDGTPAATTYVSPTELTFVVQPSLETAVRTVPVTVQDGATAGLGDAPFYFRNARVAGDTPIETGVVYVPARGPGQGLALAGDGMLRAPLATDAHAGTITEPATADKQHARVRDSVTGLARWEPVTGGMEEPPQEPVTIWGRSSSGARGWLPIEHTPAMEEPPMEPVALWARSSGGARGWLEIPEAQAGMEEPPANPVAIWGRSSAGARGWLEVPTFDHLKGFVEKIGDTMTGFLTLHAQPVNPFHAATKDYVDLSEPQEAPHNGKAYARQDGQWVEVEEGSIEEPPAEPVAVWGRSSAGARGWLEVVTTDHLDGFVQKIGDTMLGKLTLDGNPILPFHAATKDYVDLNDMPEAPRDGKIYGRKDALWEEVPEGGSMDEPPASPVAIWGRSSAGARGWIAIDDSGVRVAGDEPGEKGIVYVPDKYGLALGEDGRLTLAPCTPSQYGGIFDAPFSDPANPISYLRQNAAWVEAAAGMVIEAGVGLEKTGDTIDLQRANTNGEIGGVIVVARGPTNGLEIDPITATIWAPLATATLAGSIVEPPADAKRYMRTNDIMTGAVWVEGGGGVMIADDAPTTGKVGDLWFESDSGALFVFYDDGDSQQWVETGVGGGDPFDEAPIDGTPYARQDAAWVPTASMVAFGDTPPATSVPGQLWWETDSGALFCYYDDGSSTQWVMVGTPSGGGGGAPFPEAPIDNTPYSRMNASWVPALPEAPADGKQYARKDTAWAEVIASAVTVADTAPATPKQGDLWFDSTTGETYLWFEDGTSNQWVQQAPGAGGTPFPEAPVDGKQYGRQDAAWSEITPGGAIISDTAPANPVAGLLWFDSTTGETYIWFDDGTSQQWVQQAPGASATPFPEAPIDGKQYARKDAAWSEVVTTATTVADAPPPTPKQGDLWFNATTMDTFIWYDDGTSAQWVQQAPGAGADFTGYATEAWVNSQIASAVIDAEAFARSGQVERLLARMDAMQAELDELKGKRKAGPTRLQKLASRPRPPRDKS